MSNVFIQNTTLKQSKNTIYFDSIFETDWIQVPAVFNIRGGSNPPIRTKWN